MLNHFNAEEFFKAKDNVQYDVAWESVSEEGGLAKIRNTTVDALERRLSEVGGNNSAETSNVHQKAAEANAIQNQWTYETVKHSKTGDDMHVVKSNAHMTDEEYAKQKERANKFDGYWSRFNKGFTFPDKESAEKFMRGVEPEMQKTGENVDHADEGIRFRSDEKPRSASGVRLFDEAENIKNSYSNLSSEDLFVSLQDSNSNKVKYDKALELARRILAGETSIVGETEKNWGGARSILLKASSILSRGITQSVRGEIRSLKGREQDIKKREIDSLVMNELISLAKHCNVVVKERERGDFGEPFLVMNGKELTKGFAIGYGAESRVYESTENGYVIKDTYARNIDTEDGTISGRLENINLWNQIVPFARYELVGIRQDGDRGCALIMKQPLFKGKNLSMAVNPKTGQDYTHEERMEMLDNYMYSVYGLHRESRENGDVYTDGIIEIGDVADNHSNVMIDENGRLCIVDGFARYAKNDYAGEIMREDYQFIDKIEINNKTDRVAEGAQGTIDSLGGKGTVHRGIDSVTDSRVRRNLKSGEDIKGWYDTRTGEVHIFAPNCESEYDAQRTVFHEKVGHEGLRKVMGEENFKKFLHRVFGGITGDARKALML